MAEDQTANTDPFDFERSLKELEALVARMEGGELTLEQSLQAFEHGIRLTRDCQNALREAEQKVEILLGKEGGAATVEDFAAGSDGGA